MKRIIEIKAELYDLLDHNCDGYLVAGREWPIDYKPCSGCLKRGELEDELQKLLAARAAGGEGCDSTST